MAADKLSLVIDGRSLLERAVLAADAVAAPIVVAGARPPWWPAIAPTVVFVSEDPPFGGPVAGIAAGLSVLGEETERVFVLAGDLADPAAVVVALTEVEAGDDGVVLEDAQGWPQYLAGRYDAVALRAAVAGVGVARDVSVRALMATLALRRLPANPLVTRDLDTPDDAKMAGAQLPPMRIDGALPGRRCGPSAPIHDSES